MYCTHRDIEWRFSRSGVLGRGELGVAVWQGRGVGEVAGGGGEELVKSIVSCSKIVPNSVTLSFSLDWNKE